MTNPSDCTDLLEQTGCDALRGPSYRNPTSGSQTEAVHRATAGTPEASMPQNAPLSFLLHNLSASPVSLLARWSFDALSWLSNFISFPFHDISLQSETMKRVFRQHTSPEMGFVPNFLIQGTMLLQKEST